MEKREHGELKEAYYTGNSMRGMFVPGDILLLSATTYGDLECGDIVAVFDSTPYYVHRVIRKTPESAVTMGDNNSAPDSIPLTEKSQFMRVKAFIPVKNPGQALPVDGGGRGMIRFSRRQRIVRLRKIREKALSKFRIIGCLRIPARNEIRFRNGTIQWNCGPIPVAARSPDGRTSYLHWTKRLVFRIPKQATTQEDAGAGNDLAENAKP